MHLACNDKLRTLVNPNTLSIDKVIVIGEKAQEKVTRITFL